MSTMTPSRIRTSLEPEAQQRVGELLQPVLVDLIELSLTGKQLHWTVVGPRFKVVHEHLDELIAEYREHSDELAEYLATIGIVPDGRAVRIAGDSPVDPVEAAYLDDAKVLELMADRIERLAKDVRGRIRQAGELDPGAEDLLVNLLRTLDKQLWMVSAQR